MPYKYEKERAKLLAERRKQHANQGYNPDNMVKRAFDPQTHERVWDETRRLWIERRKA